MIGTIETYVFMCGMDFSIRSRVIHSGTIIEVPDEA